MLSRIMVANRRPPAGCMLLAISLFLALLCSEGVSNAQAIVRSLAGQRTSSPPKAVPLQIIEANNIRFTRLSVSQGLSQTRAHNIVQDGQGFMWFGTQYGLDRYDGYTFKVFIHDPTQENSLGCVSIRALFRDQSGTLWVGCDRSVDRYDAATQTFRHYALEGAPFTISQDRENAIWVSTNNGLYRLDPLTGKTRRYGHDPANPHSLSSNDVKMAGEDQESRFWVSDGGKLEEFDRERGEVLRTVDVPNNARSAVMFYVDHLDTFWVMYTLTGEESGLATLDRTKNELIRFSIHEGSGAVITAGIHTAVEDASGTLWFATNGAGLLKLDRENSTLVRYRNHMGDSDSLADDRVIALCADREGNVWEGLHAMEPNFFHSSNTGFSSLLREHDNPHSLGESFVNAIYEDHEKILWISTTGALLRVNPNSGERTFYRLPGESGDDDVIAITEDHAGNLWMGTAGAGLNRFDRKTGKYTSYRHDPKNPLSISSDVVSRIAVDPDGTLWLSTWDGLDRFDPKTDGAVVYRYHPGRAEHLFNVAIAPDRTLWIGGFSGLYHFDPVTERFKVYSHVLGNPRSLSDNVVNAVLVDHSGSIWATTENGLSRLDILKGEFQNYYARDGLASNALSCVLEDQVGTLWISSNQGISAFRPSTNRFQNFSAADGISSVDLTGWDACFKSASGRMFFGGFGGGVAFDPREELGRAETLPIVLTDFRVSDRSVAIGPMATLTKAIDHTTEVTLTHAQDRFSLTFAALGFWNAAAIRYRFRLEDLNKDWIEVGGDGRTVSYTTLPASTYTFRAQAQIRPNVWTQPGIVLRITVLPPWWATVWFRALCTIATACLLWVLYLFRLRRVSAEIHARAEERLHERERIARELHDTLLQGIQGLILHFHLAAKRISTSDPVRKMIDETLQRAEEILVEGRDRVRGLRRPSEVTSDLAEVFSEQAKDLAQTNPAELHILVNGTPHTLDPLVRDEVFWIGREALSNAFRHSDAKHIEIEIEYHPEGFRLRFRDDGRGIEPRILQSGGPTDHWGLLGMRERAEKVGGTLDISSQIGWGTEVKLKISGELAYYHRIKDRHATASRFKGR